MKLMKNGWRLGFSLFSNSVNEFNAERFQFCVKYLIVPTTFAIRGETYCLGFYWHRITFRRGLYWYQFSLVKSKTAQSILHYGFSL
jgi:hypothetical protein